MSIGVDGDIRKNILRSVRKSASTDCKSAVLSKVEDYPEYRIKFLQCRKQFEQPPPPVNKVPFLPHWINPEHETDLSITYKKKGAEITDLRISLVLNDDLNSKKRDVHEVSRKSSTKCSEASLILDSICNERRDRGVRSNPQNVIASGAKVCPEIAGSFDSLDEISLQKLDKKLKWIVEKRGSFARAMRRSQLLRIDEDSNDCGIVNRASKNVNISNIQSSPGERIVKPIVSKPIQLKKYDHIVSTVINTEKKVQLSIQEVPLNYWSN